MVQTHQNKSKNIQLFINFFVFDAKECRHNRKVRRDYTQVRLNEKLYSDSVIAPPLAYNHQGNSKPFLGLQTRKSLFMLVTPSLKLNSFSDDLWPLLGGIKEPHVAPDAQVADPWFRCFWVIHVDDPAWQNHEGICSMLILFQIRGLRQELM